MANTNNNDKFDVNIQNISKQYGQPRETFEILKATINNTFENLGLLDKFGPIYNVRIPFNQDLNNGSYFGFITMKDTSVHEALLNRLQHTSIKFGGIQLEFLKGFTHRPDNKIDDCMNDEQSTRNSRNRSLITYEDNTSSVTNTSHQSSPKRRRQSSEKDIIEVHEEDVLLQQEYQMAISKSQQAFIKSKLEAIRKREQQIITKERELEDREKALSEQEKWVADKKIIVNTAQKTLKELKNQFLKERWDYEAKVIKSERDIVKRKRDNFTAQIKSMQDAIDLKEHGIDRKQVMLDAKLQKITDEGKLNQDEDKPQDEIEGTTDQGKKYK
jgi:hypothetical protein